MVSARTAPYLVEEHSEEIGRLRRRVEELKAELGAVVVAHNYQRPEVQEVADFIGDSLELSRRCAELADIDVIVFCGVDFMAESAKILNPARTVLLSHPRALCPMAQMIDAEDLREWKARYPKAAVVAYVNTSAAVKAESDICCTSANAVRVVESLPQEEILFVPDRHLADYVATQTKKRIIPYPGFCITHRRLRPEHVIAAKHAHPEAPVLVHPECVAEVIELADAVLSTSQMVRYVNNSPAAEFLIGTEMGLIHRMRKENPDKSFYLLTTGLVCPTMKRTTLAEVVKTMEGGENEIMVPEEVRLRAKQALDRMLEIV